MELLYSTSHDLAGFQHLAPASKVWIYQSDRAFEPQELTEIKQLIAAFVQKWASHGTALFAGGDLLYSRFLILMVDESMAGASGCSIDSSVNFVRQLERQFQVGFFDRLSFAWMQNDQVELAPKSVFKQLFQEGIINENTLVFDNLVQNKAQLEAEWLKPIRDSWHKKFV